MSRSQRRASRALIAVLAVCLVIGLVFWFHNVNQSNARQAQPNAQAPAQPSALSDPQPAAPSVPPPVVTQTPVGPPPDALPVRTVAQTAPPTNPSAPANPSPTPAPAGAPPVASDRPLVDGKSAIEGGYLLRGRTILNEALVAGTLDEAEQLQARQLIAVANQSLIFSPARNPQDPFVSVYVVAPGDSLAKIAFRHDVTWELLARMNGISDPRKLRAGQKIKVVQGPFTAVVDKGSFAIDLWLGPPQGRQSLFVARYSVGLGRDGSTPSGTWMVRNGGKLKNPKFWGAGDLPPMEADDPKNPLGEFWIALDGTDGNAVGKESYGIHGTIEPESIGKMASLGCIRLRNEDVALVYEMLVDGKSTIVVRD